MKRSFGAVAASLLFAPAVVALTSIPSTAETCNGQSVPSQWLGTNSSDVFHGNTNDNAMHGQAGSDVIGGNSGRDDICGGSERDVVRGDWYLSGGTWYPPDNGAGGDYVLGGDGCDYVGGNGADDKVLGGPGNDAPTLYGGCQEIGPTVYSGQLQGHESDDEVNGGDGDDYLVGGTGTDIGHGNLGWDYCDNSFESVVLSCEEFV